MRKLVNVACGDDYTDAASILGVIDSSGGYFNVSGADVFMKLQWGPSGQAKQTDEVHVPVGGGVLAAKTSGVLFRNFVAGSVATVSAALAEKTEPAIQIAATGQSAITSGVGPTPSVALPLTPTDAQQAILVDNVVTPSYYWLVQWSATVGKWLFLGGIPWSKAGSANTVINALGVQPVAGWWTDAASEFVVPVAGTYVLDCEADISRNGGPNGGISMSAFKNAALVNRTANGKIENALNNNETIGLDTTAPFSAAVGDTVGCALNGVGVGTWQQAWKEVSLTPLSFP